MEEVHIYEKHTRTVRKRSRSVGSYRDATISSSQKEIRRSDSNDVSNSNVESHLKPQGKHSKDKILNTPASANTSSLFAPRFRHSRSPSPRYQPPSAIQGLDGFDINTLKRISKLGSPERARRRSRSRSVSSNNPREIYYNTTHKVIKTTPPRYEDDRIFADTDGAKSRNTRGWKNDTSVQNKHHGEEAVENNWSVSASLNGCLDAGDVKEYYRRSVEGKDAEGNPVTRVDEYERTVFRKVRDALILTCFI